MNNDHLSLVNNLLSAHVLVNIVTTVGVVCMEHLSLIVYNPSLLLAFKLLFMRPYTILLVHVCIMGHHHHIMCTQL